MPVVRIFDSRPSTASRLSYLNNAHRDSTLPSPKGCLIGRLLPRVLLSEKGVSTENIQFATTDAGKPYFACPSSFFPFFRVLNACGPPWSTS